MKKSILKRLFYTLIPAMLVTLIAVADLIGDTIGGQLYWNHYQGVNGFNADINDSSPTMATVIDPGVEFTRSTVNVSYWADFDSNTLTIGYTSTLSEPNQIPAIIMNFSDLNFGGDIVGVQIISNDFKQTNTLNISFGSDSVYVDLPWMNLRKNDTVELKLLIVTSPK